MTSPQYPVPQDEPEAGRVAGSADQGGAEPHQHFWQALPQIAARSVRRYSRRLQANARLTALLRNEEEDLVATALLKFCGAFEKFIATMDPPPRNLTAVALDYIDQAACSVVTDFAKQTRLNIISLEELKHEPISSDEQLASESEKDPLWMFSGDQRRAEIISFPPFHRLDDLDQVIICLRSSSMSFETIAEQLYLEYVDEGREAPGSYMKTISVEAIRHRYYRARLKLIAASDKDTGDVL